MIIASAIHPRVNVPIIDSVDDVRYAGVGTVEFRWGDRHRGTHMTAHYSPYTQTYWITQHVMTLRSDADGTGAFRSEPIADRAEWSALWNECLEIIDPGRVTRIQGAA